MVLRTLVTTARLTTKEILLFPLILDRLACSSTVRATVSNTGDVNVSNEATGFSITTNSGKVSLAGSMQVGDFSTGVDLNGNNNSVTLAAKDLKVVGQKATGINVSGDEYRVNITGNVLVDKG